MEEGWGGSPLLVNPAQYQHDPVTLVYTAQARGRYAYLQQAGGPSGDGLRPHGGCRRLLQGWQGKGQVESYAAKNPEK
jgi:hypothetical protein